VCTLFEYLQIQKLRFDTLRAYRSGDWRKIPIKENGQSLVQVPEAMVFPYYARVMKLVPDERIYLREEAFEKVLRAQSWLQARGFDLMVYDGWRSVELQENLFWYYMRAFTANKFDQKEQFDQLDSFDSIRDYFKSLPPELQAVMHEANRTYVSWPSKDPTAPSPHTTGGAVDIWLFEEGKAANLGIPFDWMEEDAGAFYHLKLRRKKFPGGDRRVHKTRIGPTLFSLWPRLASVVTDPNCGTSIGGIRWMPW